MFVCLIDRSSSMVKLIDTYLYANTNTT